MKRRTFLVGGAAAIAGAASRPHIALAHETVPTESLSSSDLASAAARLRKQFLADFEPAYVENVIIPHFLVSVYEGERLFLPMIDVELTKENALPNDLWGLLSETWKPDSGRRRHGFLQGLEKRGPDNRRKRIYMSA